MIPVRIWEFRVLLGESECFLFFAWWAGTLLLEKEIVEISHHSLWATQSPPTPQPCASSWLTLDPEGAEVTDEASASAACLHFRLQPVQWRTGISWAQASGTCPDACWDSARVVGEAALESCGTCSLESWSWSCEDLKKTHWERRIMVTLFYKLLALVAPFSHSECKFPPTYQSSCFAFLSVVYSAVLQPWLKVFFYCFKLKGCPSDNTIPHLFTNTNTGVWAA